MKYCLVTREATAAAENNPLGMMHPLLFCCSHRSPADHDGVRLGVALRLSGTLERSAGLTAAVALPGTSVSTADPQEGCGSHSSRPPPQQGVRPRPPRLPRASDARQMSSTAYQNHWLAIGLRAIRDRIIGLRAGQNVRTLLTSWG